MGLEDGEEFVGGFAGGFLARQYVPGYGVYATTRRIIGVALTSTPARQFLGGALAGFVQSFIYKTGMVRCRRSPFYLGRLSGQAA